MKTVFTLAMILLTSFIMAEMPIEVKEASNHMDEIMNKPSLFVDYSRGLNQTNKVVFVGVVDKAAKSYPDIDVNVHSNRLVLLEKYYYIATNSMPHLNVPIVITTGGLGNMAMASMVFVYDKTNNVYKVVSNDLDFTFDQGADVVLIFDDRTSIGAKFKSERRRKTNREGSQYKGQGLSAW